MSKTCGGCTYCGTPRDEIVEQGGKRYTVQRAECFVEPPTAALVPQVNKLTNQGTMGSVMVERQVDITRPACRHWEG